MRFPPIKKKFEGLGSQPLMDHPLSFTGWRGSFPAMSGHPLPTTTTKYLNNPVS